jgi:hypothetical protein
MGPVWRREDFVAAVRGAVEAGTGFAAGKLGVAERAWLRYPMVRVEETDPRRRRAFELVLAFKSQQSGVYPLDPDFHARWCAVYVDHFRRLDSIGLLREAHPESRELLAFHGISGSVVLDSKDQQPDRSSPHDGSRCYLDSFRDRDLLLIAPFGELLQARANADTFEAVWAKIGKPWFYPRSVQALEVPYGFTPATRARYPTCLDVLAELVDDVRRRKFDVALIAAGAHGVPLASEIKKRGRVAISLGGHLQVLFGVLGERWRDKRSWAERYFNDAWIGMPERYVPDHVERGENYW